MFDSLAATVSQSAEDFWAWFGDKPLKILLILVIGMIAIFVLRRVVTALTERMALGQKARSDQEAGDSEGAAGGVTGKRRRQKMLASQALAGALNAVTPRVAERRAQRARTVGSVLNSSINIVMGTLMVMSILQAMGFNPVGLIAGAGIVGIALGFGAQSLVKDFISGVFLLIEDQFGVGDFVDLGSGAVGTVEAMGLRLTQVRAFDGTLWYVRNGEILRAGNSTQEWSRAVAPIQVPLEADIGVVLTALDRATEHVKNDPEVAHLLLETPSVRGVDAVDRVGMTFTLHAQVRPAEQWLVARTMRSAAHTALLDAGVVMAPTMAAYNDLASGRTPGAS